MKDLTGQNGAERDKPVVNTLDDVIAQAGFTEGVYLSDLPLGAVLEIRTQNHDYRLEHCGGGKAFISGHPDICPQRVMAKIHGSTWGGSMLRMGFIGKDMHLEFRASNASTVTTSRILEIHGLSSAPVSDGSQSRSVCKSIDSTH